ncbi:GOX/HAO [Ectocarpus sp. CCAP 1310/34]|nr:GOX/HAO [Ectocarpus sp. CCAP 1310/34]
MGRLEDQSATASASSAGAPLPTPKMDTARPGCTRVNLADYERRAKVVLSKGEFDYFAGGANDMVTLRENRAAYRRLRLRPRVLRDVSSVDTTRTVLGERMAHPIGISPTAEHRAAHDDGELATARAAAGTCSMMVVSSSATTALEDVATAGGPNMRRWFQLSLSSRKNRAVLAGLVRRANAAGYTALVVTVDRPVLGRREADLRNCYELASRLAEGRVVSATGARIGRRPDGTIDLGQASDARPEAGKSLNWDDVHWLRTICGDMKIVLKSVMTREAAEEALAHGVDALWVSNHGGRQLDTVPATIEILPEVVQAVRGRCEVFVDGGIRRGTDVLKALALGATAIFVGRPVIWGLAHSGEDGVTDVINLLNEELVQAMRLMGCKKLADIERSMVVHQSSFHAKL